jgi:hypothetical protein
LRKKTEDRSRKSECGVCLLLTVFAMAGHAQSAAEVRGRKIINDAVAALGGDKFLNMEDRIESGRAYSFYLEKLTGLSIAKIYTRYQSVTLGKSGEELGVRERQAFGKNEDSSVLFREDGAWEITFRGSKPLEKERVDRYHDTTLRNFFYILRQRLQEPGMIFESKGVEVVENLPVDVVVITDSVNRTVTVYFHQSTKLPVRQSWVWRDPQTKERNEEITRFSRYRDVGGGVQWPHQILRERNGEKIYEMFSESVVIDKDLTDNIFSTEATGKVPIKKK